MSHGTCVSSFHGQSHACDRRRAAAKGKATGRQGKNLSQRLVRNYLSRYVDSRSRRLAALSAFETVASTVDSASAASWSRDSLHERD